MSVYVFVRFSVSFYAFVRFSVSASVFIRFSVSVYVFVRFPVSAYVFVDFQCPLLFLIDFSFRLCFLLDFQCPLVCLLDFQSPLMCRLLRRLRFKFICDPLWKFYLKIIIHYYLLIVSSQAGTVLPSNATDAMWTLCTYLLSLNIHKEIWCTLPI